MRKKFNLSVQFYSLSYNIIPIRLPFSLMPFCKLSKYLNRITCSLASTNLFLAKDISSRSMHSLQSLRTSCKRVTNSSFDLASSTCSFRSIMFIKNSAFITVFPSGISTWCNFKRYSALWIGDIRTLYALLTSELHSADKCCSLSVLKIQIELKSP